MGKIMLNGKQYGVGGIEKAKDISYDNTSSGMSATNVQGALDEVKAGLNNFTLQISVLTPVKTMTVGSQNWVAKYGRVVFGTIIFSTTTTSTQNTVMFRTPYPLRYPTCLIIRADGGGTYLMGTTTENSNELIAMYGDGIPAGVYRVSFTYLTTL